MIPLVVNAQGTIAGDAIQEELLVTSVGIERVTTHTVFLLKEGAEVNTTELNCNIPATVDPQTVSSSITFAGDLLGDTLKNMASLIILPSGCGEQNLARFASTITVYEYFEQSGQLTDAIANQIRKYVQTGMQKHLTLRNAAVGSYRFFTSSSGSTFLTAFTVKLFRKAQSFFAVDVNLINTALTFIILKQEANGGFQEDVTSANYRRHGGFNGKVTLTSYIAILLTEALTAYPGYLNNRNRAITYIAANIDETNAYELAIAFHAPYLVNHSTFNASYNALLRLSVENNEIMYWRVSNVLSLNVETTAYALLFMRHVDPDRSVKHARYLISQKNQNGGWASTQDTVMAVESLASVSALVTQFNGTITLLTWPSVGPSFEVEINQANRIELQSFRLHSDSRSVTIHARGPKTGKAIISLTYRYFEHMDDTPQRFIIRHRILANCNTPLRAEVCINYIPMGADVLSNMVIMRMNMPSGYVYDPETPLAPEIRIGSIEFSRICFD